MKKLHRLQKRIEEIQKLEDKLYDYIISSAKEAPIYPGDMRKICTLFYNVLCHKSDLMLKYNYWSKYESTIEI